jgi:dihydroneopterin aldolase
MIKSILEINKLMLPIFIGVEESERTKAQVIEFNIAMEFEALPKACKSDHIDEAICYDKLTSLIKDFCNNKEFRLIEHLCYSLHQHLQTSLPHIKLKLQVCKTPPIEEIQGNCCYSIIA